MPKRIADLPVGSKVRFGSYSVSGEEPHRIAWIKVHRDNTLFNEFVEDILPFDAKEPLNPFNYRRTYGSNRYSVSNLGGFINSEEVDWFQKQTETDTPPAGEYLRDGHPGYKNKPGFLHFFQQWELDQIMTSKVVTKLNSSDVVHGDDDTVLYDVVFQRVFLASKDNLYGNKLNEGILWDYFASYGSRVCSASEECVRHAYASEELDLEYNPACGYFLRTCNPDETCYVEKVDRYGDAENEVAYDGCTGLRVALVIDQNALVSDKPDENGYYQVLEVPVTAFEISDDEFLTLIKQ